MKKMSIISLLSISSIFSACVFDHFIHMRGDGNLISPEKSVSPFEEINIRGSAEVRFHASQEYRTRVTVDANLLEYTEIVTRGNTLNIGTENGSYSFTKYQVDVYCPAVTGVSVSGSGRFQCIDDISVPTFTSNVSGSGNIQGKIKCGIFTAKISGSGDITVSGNGRESDIEISGSGSFDGDEFVMNKANVHISGSGKAYVNVSENLDVKISGSGEVTYRGSPELDSKISGSGRIKRR